MTDDTTPLEEEDMVDAQIEQDAHGEDSEPDDIAITDPADVPRDEGDQAAHDDPDNPTA